MPTKDKQPAKLAVTPRKATVEMKSRDLFKEYVVCFESEKLHKEISKQLNIKQKNRIAPQLNQANTFVPVNNSIIQINTMLNQVHQIQDININLATAICFSSDVTITAKSVVIVASHLIVQKQCHLNIVHSELGIVGFQKHNGEQLTINIGNGLVFLDASIKKVVVNKEARVKDFGEIVRANQPLNQLVGLCNVCFPLIFAGNKGFWVGDLGWE